MQAGRRTRDSAFCLDALVAAAARTTNRSVPDNYGGVCPGIIQMGLGTSGFAPLLEIAPGEYCYSFFPALPETVARAFFSRLLGHYNDKYGKHAGDAFLDYYGRFLEDYVFKLLSESIKKPVVGDDEAFETKDTSDNRIVDAVIIELPDITFVEVTAKRFNLTKTIIAGNIESLECDPKLMAVEKSKQLEASVQLFDEGKLFMVPAKPGQVKRKHTVLILQEFPQYAAIRRRTIELIREAGVELPNLQFVTVCAHSVSSVEGELNSIKCIAGITVHYS
jgi:hypothetical protein